MMKKQYSFIFPGMIFGFLLSKAEFSNYDLFMEMFLLNDLRLLWTMAVAVGVATVSINLVKKFKLASLSGDPIEPKTKSLHRGTLIGGLTFGLGWGISGA
jgi:uncharacterized membrane protein YedE/YeeE